MAKKEIKALIFDIGGVLVLGRDLGQLKNGSSKGVHEAIVQELGISIDQWFDSIGEIYEKTVTGKVSEKEFLAFTSKTFHKTPKYLKKLFIEKYEKNFKKNTALFNLALKLKKEGYKIAILSDQHWLSKAAIVPKIGLRHFNPIVISCDVGFRKPLPEIYKLTLKKIKLKPEECVFIDNQEWNLPPARKLGMKTILFKNNKQTFKELERLGVK